MNTIYIYHPNFATNRKISLLELLLDETCAYGTIYIPHSALSYVAPINRRLPSKATYELLLRLASYFEVWQTSIIPEEKNSYSSYSFDATALSMESLKTDCYLISRYKKILLEAEMFDAAVSSILQQSEELGQQDTILFYLQDMLTEGKTYLTLFLATEPFLIYTGDTVCYNILTTFAKAFGNALEKQGHLVEYFDLSKENIADASRLSGCKYQAIIGFQSFMFSVRLADNTTFLHDTITGPKYNFVLDHPVRMTKALKDIPASVTILSLDKNYVSFIKKYYPFGAKLLPPGGIETTQNFTKNAAIYDISFIGTYNDISSETLEEVHALPRERRFLIHNLWLTMGKYPHLPAETALALVLEKKERTLSDLEFLKLFEELQKYILFFASYYRHRILKTLLDSGLTIDVFGKSWGYSPLCKHPNFVWHENDLSTEECLSIWHSSKLSLNIMSWHKNAITERILNIMLQKSLCITERNPYMESYFSQGKDILYYDLGNITAMIPHIQSLLSQEEKRETLAENGYQIAQCHHTWSERSKQFLDYLDTASLL